MAIARRLRVRRRAAAAAAWPNLGERLLDISATPGPSESSVNVEDTEDESLQPKTQNR